MADAYRVVINKEVIKQIEPKCERNEKELNKEYVKIEFNKQIPPITRAGRDPELDIKVITTEEESREVVRELRRRSAQYHAVGFDCEWVNRNGRHPVAMLQLSTHDGYCALFRLCHIKSIPVCLKDFLEDKTVLKLGVGCNSDADYLQSDYSVHSKATLDLNYIAKLCQYETGGLATLAKDLLDIVLDKDLTIRCSDWEAEELSVQQINYAARDAHVAIAIFVKLIDYYYKSPETTIHWDNVLKLCENYTDKSYFKFRNSKVKEKEKQQKQTCTREASVKTYYPLYSKRSRAPYYTDWGVRAPDGEMLCDCFYKKAQWYLNENLADRVQKRPPEIRLRFEPAGRQLGGVGFYLKQSRDRCVVCGARQLFIKRNIVPDDYLKFFPEDMRREAREQVVLCAACWQRGNWRELTLREQLGARAAVAGGPCFVKSEGCRKIRDAAKMLLGLRAFSMSTNRAELENLLLQEYLQEYSISKDLLIRAARLEIVFVYDERHSAAVVRHYEARGKLRALRAAWLRLFYDALPPAARARQLADADDGLLEELKMNPFS